MSSQVVGSEPLYIMAEPARPDSPKGSSETETGASCGPGHKEEEAGHGPLPGLWGRGLRLPLRCGEHRVQLSVPAGVRLDRVWGEWQKYKQRPEVDLLPFPGPFPAGPLAVAGGPRKTAPVNVLVSHLLVVEPEKLYAMPDPAGPDGHLPAVIVVTISWARSIPGFSLLLLSDQMSGLQSLWMELLVPGVAQLSLPLQDELAFAEDLVLDEEGARAAGLGERGSALLQLVRRLQALRLEGEEYVLLKALALASSSCVHIEDAEAVEQLLEALHEVLLEYEAGRAGTGEGAEPCRAGRLLLTLPLLRQTVGKVLAHFYGVKLEVKVPVHKLFLEMLEAMMD
uniref:NR LBD domain-containing protein n=1 Tax=Macaca nemestrina TaxID=9545 RepID=A0A2K6E6K2_MACNE